MMTIVLLLAATLSAAIPGVNERRTGRRMRDMTVREVVRLLKEWHAAREGGE
jgi:hypothetical protein